MKVCRGKGGRRKGITRQRQRIKKRGGYSYIFARGESVEKEEIEISSGERVDRPSSKHVPRDFAHKAIAEGMKGVRAEPLRVLT